MLPVQNDLIFDIGCHIGQDSDFYLAMGYKVIGVEANPTLAQGLRVKFSEEINSGQFTLLEVAITSDGKPAIFFENPIASEWSTTVASWANRRDHQFGSVSNSFEVPGISVKTMIETYGCPDYMKVDIEGSDFLCLQQLEDCDTKPLYVSIESTKYSFVGLLKEFVLFRKLGYDRFAVVDQRRHSAKEFQTLKNIPLEYVFEVDSSGSFGRQLDGIWNGSIRAILKYVPIFFLYKAIGDDTTLPKIMSRIPIAKIILKYFQKKNGWYDTHAKHKSV
jgi:FkbM family methyltransferase